MSAEPLRGAKVVVTGVTGQVGEPVARALAQDNEVYGAARFRDAATRERLEAAGIHCVAIDLATGDVGGLPADADYVLNFAVTKTNDWDVDLQANSGGLAWLMEHHQKARAFLHCSTTGVYKIGSTPVLALPGKDTTSIAVGLSALASQSATNLANTAVGTQALYSNSTGSENTAVGSGALYQNINNINTAIGWNALTSNTTGSPCRRPSVRTRAELSAR